MEWAKCKHITDLMDEVLHFGLQAPPLELDCDQFVSTHPWAVSLTNQLFLLGQERSKTTTRLTTPSLFKKDHSKLQQKLDRNFPMRE